MTIPETPEAMRDWLLAILYAPNPERLLPLLRTENSIHPLFQEFERAEAIPAGPVQWHSGSLQAHICRCMGAVAGDGLAVWMALCHDIGKCYTPEEQWPHHYQHEVLGEQPARDLGKRLHLPELYQEAGALAVRLHMKAGQYDELRRGTRCDLLLAVHEAGLDQPFWKLVDADAKRLVSLPALQDLDALLQAADPDLPPARQRDLYCRALAAKQPERKKNKISI